MESMSGENGLNENKKLNKKTYKSSKLITFNGKSDHYES